MHFTVSMKHSCASSNQETCWAYSTAGRIVAPSKWQLKSVMNSRHACSYKWIYNVGVPFGVACWEVTQHHHTFPEINIHNLQLVLIQSLMHLRSYMDACMLVTWSQVAFGHTYIAVCCRLYMTLVIGVSMINTHWSENCWFFTSEQQAVEYCSQRGVVILCHDVTNIYKMDFICLMTHNREYMMTIRTWRALGRSKAELLIRHQSYTN